MIAAMRKILSEIADAIFASQLRRAAIKIEQHRHLFVRHAQ